MHTVDMGYVYTLYHLKQNKLFKKLRNFQRKWIYNILEFCTNVNFFKTTTALLLQPIRYIPCKNKLKCSKLIILSVWFRSPLYMSHCKNELQKRPAYFLQRKEIIWWFLCLLYKSSSHIFIHLSTKKYLLLKEKQNFSWAWK